QRRTSEGGVPRHEAVGTHQLGIDRRISGNKHIALADLALQLVGDLRRAGPVAPVLVTGGLAKIWSESLLHDVDQRAGVEHLDWTVTTASGRVSPSPTAAGRQQRNHRQQGNYDRAQAPPDPGRADGDRHPSPPSCRSLRVHHYRVNDGAFAL